MNPSVKLSQVPPYLFAEIDKKIAAARAKGVDIINLGIGDPDRPTPKLIVDEMHKSIDDASTHDYPPYNGTGEFRTACANWMKRRFGVDVDPNDEVIALIGSKEGIAHIIFAMVDPGDYVLVPDPGYPVYKSFTILSGGNVHTMPLTPENNFQPDLNQIPEEIAKKAKVMFINYPNNPTGAISDLEYFKKVLEFAKKYDILICNDMAYSEMTFDNYVAPSFLEVEGAKDHCIEFYSHSKTYNMTGWRVGFAAGSKKGIDALSLIKNNCDSGVFKAIQKAATLALDNHENLIDDINSVYQERRDLFIEGLNKLGWNLKPNKATFYLWLPVPEGMTSVEFATLMLEKAGIVVPAGNGYGNCGEGFFRIALTVSTDRLNEALSRMEKNNIRFDALKVAQ
ncbi:MAG: LL-diaminopimelate aminotransferase [Vampirovibrionia bacterium]